MPALFFVFRPNTNFVSLLKAVKDRLTPSLFDLDEAPAVAPSNVPGIKKLAQVKKPLPAATIASLFDEVLHPRAGEGMQLMNPETGQIIRGGQFAPKLDKDNDKHGHHGKHANNDAGRGDAESESGDGGTGLPAESDGQSPRPLRRLSEKRNARRSSGGSAESLFGTGSLFDTGGGDASAGSTERSGAGLPSDTGQGAGAGPTGEQSSVAEPESSTDNSNRVEAEREELGYTGGELSVVDTESVADGVHTISAPRKVGYDYRITEDDHVGEGGFRQKLVDNMEALRLLKELDAEGRNATPEEQARLVKYTGWGWAQALFSPRNITIGGRYAKEHAALLALLTPDEMRSARESTLNAHFTSPDVIRAIWQGVEHLGFTGGRVLEPAAGVGHFFGMMPESVAVRSSLAAVELDPLTARICQQLYQNASVKQCGFEETSSTDPEKRKDFLPDGFFDLAISNVPFGDYAVSDPQFDLAGKGFLTRRIHNYFFAQALNKVRPGGLIAFITGTGTMDARTAQKFREYVSSQADLVGAFRLPNDAFEENAGTQVTTDVLFLRKRMPGESPNGVEWTRSVPFALPNDAGEVPLSEYHAAHPETSLLGTPVRSEMNGMNEMRMAVASDGRAAGDALAAGAVAQLPANIYTERGSGTEATLPEKQFEFVPAPDFVKMHGYGLVNGELLVREPEGMRPCVFAMGSDGKPLIDASGNPIRAMNLTAEARVRGMIGVRDKLRELHRAMLDPNIEDEQLKPMQFALKLAYSGFVRKHGNIHDTANLRAFASDPDLALLCSLEEYNKDTKQVKLSDVFTTRTMRPVMPPTSAGTPGDALLHSLNQHGNLNWHYMAKLTGKTPEELQSHLRTAGRVFKNPNGDWEERSTYLSGNVKEKLRQAQAASKLDPDYEKNVEELKSVQPADLSPADIDVHFGAGWVPPQHIQAFACHLLGIPDYDARQKPTVDYLPTQGAWAVGSVGNAYKGTAAQTQVWGTEDVSASELIALGLNGGRPTVYMDSPTEVDDRGKPRRVKDIAATEAAEEKLAKIKDEWSKWIYKDESRQDELCGIYNERYNCDVDRHFDGGHLELPGMSEACRSRLNGHVRNAIWRQLTSPTTLLAHAVGAGKTWEIAGAAIEKRRLGLATKPMVAVPNHLVGQWAKEIQELYPGAKVLMATSKDFEKSRRREFLSRIQNGDWDMVVIGHSAFGRIPVSAEREAKHYNEQIETLQDFLHQKATEAEAEGGGGRGGRRRKDASTKEMEKALKRARAKLEKAVARRNANTDDFTNFEDLGVDSLFVDEAHLYKNLEFPTKLSRIKGLPTGGSQRALDMFLKCKHIQEHTGRGGVTFATGTPVANSLAELFTMQRYLDEEEMKHRGIAHFDAWKNNFATTKRDLEATATGEMKATERLSQFTNLPELSRMFHRFSDVLLSDQLNIARPDVERVAVSCPMSTEQEAYVQSLAERAKRLTGPMSTRPDPSEDNMLKITSDGRKNSLDQRLVNGSLPDSETSKINELVKSLKKEWEGSHDIRGTQTVFMDMGTPKATDSPDTDEEDGDELLDPVTLREKRAKKFIGNKKDPDLRAAAQAYHDFHNSRYAVDALHDGVDAETRQRVLGSAVDAENAYNAARSTVLSSVDKDAKRKANALLGVVESLNHIHGAGEESEEERSMRSSLYAQIKQKLIASGIPEAHIAMIHDANTEAKKIALFKAVNDGTVRILLGSTEKMGTGMNAQKRMVALHHMDCPWRPADLEQREGRIIRKGNINKKVRIYNYITAGTDNTASFDTYLWQLIRSKQGTIDQVMRADPTMRRADDVGDAVLHASQMIAIGYNNPLMHERNDLLQKVARLGRLQSEHLRSQYTARTRLKALPQEIADEKAHIDRLKAAIAYRDANKTMDGGKVRDRVTVMGKAYDDPEEGIAALLGEGQTVGNREMRQLGTINGFQIHAGRGEADSFGPRPLGFVLSQDHDAWRRGEMWGGHADQSNGGARGQLQKFRNVLGQQMDGALAGRERTHASAQKSKADFEGSLMPFEHQAELDRLHERLREVERGLGSDKDENAAAGASADSDDEEPLEKAESDFSGRLSYSGGKWSEHPGSGESLGSRIGRGIRSFVRGSVGLAASDVPGLRHAVRETGGRYQQGRVMATGTPGVVTTHHDIHVPESGPAAMHIASHLQKRGFDLLHLRREKDSLGVAVGTGPGEANRLETRTRHHLIATDRKTGAVHHFHLESRPWIPNPAAGKGERGTRLSEKRTGQAAKISPPPVSAVSTVHASPSPISVSGGSHTAPLPSPPVGGGRGIDVGGLAAKFDMTLHHSDAVAHDDGTRHHAFLLSHKHPSVAVDRLYKHLQAAGHPLTGVTFKHVTVDGHGKHLYRFSAQGKDGNAYTFHVIRPRHADSGRVPKTREPKEQTPGSGNAHLPRSHRFKGKK